MSSIIHNVLSPAYILDKQYKREVLIMIQDWATWLSAFVSVILCVQIYLIKRESEYKPMFKRKYGRIQVSSIGYRPQSKPNYSLRLYVEVDKPTLFFGQNYSVYKGTCLQ